MEGEHDVTVFVENTHLSSPPQSLKRGAESKAEGQPQPSYSLMPQDRYIARGQV